MRSAPVDTKRIVAMYKNRRVGTQNGTFLAMRFRCWMGGLPELNPTRIVQPVASWCPSGSYSGKREVKHKGMFTKDRAKNRAKTFTGIAEAMTEQWGELK